ncbi:inorganic phosphate transporter [Egibacter rhizosphaerae]|uniref:Inorganic phosphate transporter n=1 Tax=Egibacter rhizosphaerae TaxID=1670831 RepID=A0A411YGB9_9ACTN|nr:inorganic phosphate transporter [Egibacter rhizosphaerae]QBI20191.1 inorganic phosphate transporter [Egibacter rhizosphaerae]
MTDPLGLVFLVAALGFVVLNGVNDGGALVAASLKTPVLRPLTVIGLICATLALVPALGAAAVAGTLADGLVPADPSTRRTLLAAGLAACLLVVGLLNRRGLPTSLTLALVGGVVGAGVGAGESVEWSRVGVVVLVGIAAPFVGGALGLALRGLGAIPRSRVRSAHVVTVAGQALAYAANDGQKTYAAMAAATLAPVGAGVAPPVWMLVVVPVLFGVGAALGVRRARGTLAGGGVLRTRPRDEVAAEAASAVAVLGSSAVGAPVSMTQSIVGSLVGAGLTRGRRHVRWRAAGRLVLAWVLTLPSSALAGVVLGAMLGLL